MTGMTGLRARGAALAGALLLGALTPAHGQGAEHRTASTPLAPGLAHEVWELSGSAAPVHVARRSGGSPARLQLVQAHDAAQGGLETTSSMCRRTRGCQAAVNGDFFTPDGAAVGAVVVDGRMLRSPRPDHEQLSLEPLRATGQGLGDGGWAGHVARPDGADPLTLHGVNVPLGPGQLILYTSQYGAPTPACTCQELRLREDAGPAGTLGRPAPVTVTGPGGGGSPVPAGAAVLAAEGAAAAALLALADAARGVLLVSVSVAEPTRHNVGAHPVVLRAGQPQPDDAADPMLASAHPRTVVAWDAAGTVWLIAAEGRRAGGPGLTAQQTVAFLRRLGATDAAMLDGGGSTTFVVRGRVMGTPSDGRERPVANAVLLVRQPEAFARRAELPPPPVAAEQVAEVSPVVLPSSPPPPAPAAVAVAPPPPTVTPAAPPVEPAQTAPVASPAATTRTVAARRPADPLPERPVGHPPDRLVASPAPTPAAPLPAVIAALLGLTALGCWLRVVCAPADAVTPKRHTRRTGP